MASCLGTTSKQSSSSWTVLVLALGWSNKVKLLEVLILRFKVCCWPGQQEGNGDTNSLFIFPWRQSLCLPFGEHCLFPSPQNWEKGWCAIFTSSLSGTLGHIFQWPVVIKNEWVRVGGVKKHFITAYSEVCIMFSKPIACRAFSIWWPQMSLKVSQGDGHIILAELQYKHLLYY